MSNNELEIQKLYIFDTLHDFWKERKTVKNDDEDEDDEPMDETKLLQMQRYLAKTISSFAGLKYDNKTTELNNVNTWLSILTNNFSKSVTSRYERTIEEYYETKSPLKTDLFFESKEGITYGEIIRAWDEWSKGGKQGGRLPTLWTNYIDSYGISNILEISIGNDPVYNSFGAIQRDNKEGIVANFILNYIFPEFTLRNDTGYITFDAKAGVVGKVFRDIDNVYNLITPANIADSAVTSFSSLNNRNEYYFPSQPNYIFDANLYSKSVAKLGFSNNGFNNKNPYGFIYTINNLQFPFSSTQKQGPSVNYLVDLSLKNPNAAPNNSTIVNMTSKFLSNKAEYDSYINSGLFLDIKRCGDYEQVNSSIKSRDDGIHTYTIMTTIDVLCSLYSRIKKQNTIRLQRLF
jgi:hypothetical protein